MNKVVGIITATAALLVGGIVVAVIYIVAQWIGLI
ncbi:hypothetical protein PAP_06650 [Palaeococcus pacificus DY20341]|uniref:Uncharacterized protein n=1 Tax=Palaeococcus pacificus DY20341 TaxID=1343739 RepID=A0A075LSK4_9EURY|nr:hypothetical protein PAP_06650 [Palaeococcus pacificus DY20341]